MIKPILTKLLLMIPVSIESPLVVLPCVMLEIL